MASWIDPVFDRTILDVEYLKQNLRDSAGYENNVYFRTSDEQYFLDSGEQRIRLLSVTSDHKGAYNASDMNRVNNDLLFLQEYLRKLGVSVDIRFASRIWQMEDIPTIPEFEGYLSDVDVIRNAIVQSDDTPATPDLYYFDYARANDIEKILYDTYMSLKSTENSTYYSGDIYAGEVI